MNIPVFVVGKINDVRYAADLVERGLVDGVSMGRPLLADPDLPKKAYENRFDDITPCGSCGGRCITPEDPHHPVCKCHINPLVGHEYDYPFNPTDKPKKVLVIGAGPGGMYTAVTAAERGHDVTVWEKSKQIGGQLNLAVVSPGKQEMCKWLTHLNYRAKKAGVKFEFKKEATVENVKEFAPDAVVVATGATPLIPTFIKGVGDYPIITTHDILSRKVTIPKHGLHPRRRRSRLRDGRNAHGRRASELLCHHRQHRRRGSHARGDAAAAHDRRLPAEPQHCARQPAPRGR